MGSNRMRGNAKNIRGFIRDLLDLLKGSVMQQFEYQVYLVFF